MEHELIFMERDLRRSLHSVLLCFFFFSVSALENALEVFHVIKVKMGMILISVSRTMSLSFLVGFFFFCWLVYFFFL